MGLRRGSRDYFDLALVAPVTVPYVRYSIRSSHWFVAQALTRLLKHPSSISPTSTA